MELQENVDLAPYTTLAIGGPARYFLRVGHDEGLWKAIRFARKKRLPLFVLGGGSNLLVSDEGFPGLVLHIAQEDWIDTPGRPSQRPGTVAYEAGAGANWDLLVRTACAAGHTGIECLAGIPGLTGGAPVQNIGAYGQEVAQTIDSVTVLDLQQEKKTRLLPAAACGFAYRSSIFNSTQQGRYVVLAVGFTLSLAQQPNLTYADLAPLRDTHPTPLEVYHFVRQVRDRKGMLIDPPQPGETPHPDSRSAGSFFKNPIVPTTALAIIAASLGISASEIPHWPGPASGPDFGKIKLPAAWLIERAGFAKGFALGPVGISTRHTLALVNRTGTATCADLLRLRDLIVSTISTRFALTLEQEPVFLAA